MRLSDDTPSLVGIDHGFSFPLQYFEKYNLPFDWTLFLEDFCHYWPTAQKNMYVDFIREGVDGNGAARTGDSHWRRVCEILAHAKSVFHFDVPGSVAKSTFSGLPWLLYLRKRIPEIHFWPFDGWTVPPGKSVIAEAYPSLWSKTFPREHRNSHQHDAYTLAAWMREADQTGFLATYFKQRTSATIEGWILGV